MKFSSIVLVVMACFLSGLLSGCACDTDDSMEIRNPLRFNSRPRAVAGPDYIKVPQSYAPSYSAPQYQPAPGCAPAAAAPGCPAGCAPSYAAPSYTPVPYGYTYPR